MVNDLAKVYFAQFVDKLNDSALSISSAFLDAAVNISYFIVNSTFRYSVRAILFSHNDEAIAKLEKYILEDNRYEPMVILLEEKLRVGLSVFQLEKNIASLLLYQNAKDIPRYLKLINKDLRYLTKFYWDNYPGSTIYSHIRSLMDNDIDLTPAITFLSEQVYIDLFSFLDIVATTLEKNNKYLGLLLTKTKLGDISEEFKEYICNRHDINYKAKFNYTDYILKHSEEEFRKIEAIFLNLGDPELLLLFAEKFIKADKKKIFNKLNEIKNIEYIENFINKFEDFKKFKIWI